MESSPLLTRPVLAADLQVIVAIIISTVMFIPTISSGKEGFQYPIMTETAKSRTIKSAPTMEAIEAMHLMQH